MGFCHFPEISANILEQGRTVGHPYLHYGPTKLANQNEAGYFRERGNEETAPKMPISHSVCTVVLQQGGQMCVFFKYIKALRMFQNRPLDENLNIEICIIHPFKMK